MAAIRSYLPFVEGGGPGGAGFAGVPGLDGGVEGGEPVFGKFGGSGTPVPGGCVRGLPVEG